MTIGIPSKGSLWLGTAASGRTNSRPNQLRSPFDAGANFCRCRELEALVNRFPRKSPQSDVSLPSPP